MMPCHSPRTVSEAAALLRERPTVIAGGTDLMVAIHQKAIAPASLLDVTRLTEARGIRVDTALDIGAAETFAAIASHPLVLSHAPALAAAASSVGSEQIRSRATIGGNLVTASPSGDSIPPLLALDATTVIAGPGGLRELPLAGFIVGYRLTALDPTEILLRIRIPITSRFQSFAKVGPRRAVACSKVSLAGCAGLSASRFSSVRLAAGAVAPTVILLEETAAVLLHNEPTPDLAERAAAAAEREARPIDDVRSTAQYRRHVLGRLVSRFVRSAR